MENLRFDSWIRKSPYFEATRRYGCNRFTVLNHMYMPYGYDDPVKEYWKLVREVTLWDVAAERQVEITGPDAFAFTNLLTPRDLSKCRAGECKYTVITDENGGIINDPVLLRLDENHFWLSAADSDLLLWTKALALSTSMDVHITEPDVAPLQVQGPSSGTVMEALFDDSIHDLEYYELGHFSYRDTPVIVSRTGWTGALGYEIYPLTSDHAESLWEEVMACGKPFGITPIGPSGIRRVEAGILAYRSDMSLSNNPFEVGFGRMVDFSEGNDFIGRKALEEITARGVDRKLVGITVHADNLPETEKFLWPVVVDNKTIGHVTVCVYSPRLEKNIGYAMVAAEYSNTGTTFTVTLPTGDVEASVTKKPFLKGQDLE